jgi:hypothetical protein
MKRYISNPINNPVEIDLDYKLIKLIPYEIFHKISSKLRIRLYSLLVRNISHQILDNLYEII